MLAKTRGLGSVCCRSNPLKKEEPELLTSQVNLRARCTRLRLITSNQPNCTQRPEGTNRRLDTGHGTAQASRPSHPPPKKMETPRFSPVPTTTPHQMCTQ
ncbi:unnamed protein product [Pleuronectes platessa]|uniref:Uncharacterized protein n=1 Tax=Pleuronectes platessa TaxID=8262 RepID=A0A9N7UVC9_PLEPL|nr:unnamed protein product [Pleuronectes platessa]